MTQRREDLIRKLVARADQLAEDQADVHGQHKAARQAFAEAEAILRDAAYELVVRVQQQRREVAA